jgi:molybdopterin-guanine dinucleotide biosynthesis protein A
MAAIILSGGNNKRISTEKAFLKIGQKPIIECEIEVLTSIFSRIIIVTNSPEKYRYLKADLTSDLIPGKGPLGGIYSGLNLSQDEHNFIVSCDLPFLNKDIISYMKESAGGHDIVIPRINGLLEPLHAIYSKNCLPAIKKHLDKNDLKIQSFFNEVRVKYIEKHEIEKFDSDAIAFFNVNTEEELNKAKLIASKLL